MPSDAELAERLAARTLELVDIASESRDEAAAAEHVLATLRDGGLAVRDLGDSCVWAAPPAHSDGPLVLLAGHLDTVPAQGNRPGRRDATHVHGLGASDMKGALAVMMELGLAAASPDAPWPADGTPRLGLVFFPREELPAPESALTPLLQRTPDLCAADFAVVMEPTDNAIHAGCLGNINATWTFTGRAGHSARPWHADNAIERAAAGIMHLRESARPREVTFDGLVFTEVASVTRISGGIADNVIPDRVAAHLNFRYAPGRTPAEAEERLLELTGGHGSFELLGNNPSGAVHVNEPLARALIAAGDLEIAPKQAWTPVAEFTAHGVPALNFGPGAPAEAHKVDEKVAIDALVRSYDVLRRFLSTPAP